MNATGAHAPIETVLVTGGCGYLGSRLIRDLAADDRHPGLTVRIMDNLQRENYPALMELPPDGRYQFMEGDILDPMAVEMALEGVDAVVHLASIVRTPMSFEHPSWVKQVNHWGTSRLVESCLAAGVTRLVFASSASVYGPGGPFTEEDMCRPLGPYAQSKRRAEESVLAARERGLAPTLLRIGTIFGLAPVTRFDAVANRFAYLAGTRRPLTVYGQGDQRRPFIHVRDASEAIRLCLDRPEDTAGEVYNAVAVNASVLDLVAAVQSVDPEVQVRYTEQDILTHLSFAARSQRLLDLGWEPRHDLESGIRELIGRFASLSAIPQHLPVLE